LLLALNVCLIPLQALRSLVDALPAFGIERWADFTVPGGANYHPWMAATLMGEMMMLTAQLVFAVLLALLFFNKRRSFPPLFMAWMWISVALSVFDTWATAQIPVLAQTAPEKAVAELIRNALSLALWTAYLLRSVRVRNTFEYTHGPLEPNAPALSDQLIGSRV
jgi:hypothetical protein